MISIRWVPEALQELAEIWMTAPNRDRITEAVNRIERRLQRDPASQGESRAGDRCIVIEPPLGVIFRVRPDDRTVLVLTVWHFEKRS